MFLQPGNFTEQRAKSSKSQRKGEVQPIVKPKYFARGGEFVGEEEQVCLIGKSSVFINYLSSWAELKSNTCSGVGEENKNRRPQLPTCIEAREDFTKAGPEGLFLFLI